MPDPSTPTARPSGLTAAEAARRLAAAGPNELPRPESRNLVRIVAEVLAEPMLALLLVGGLVYLLLGSRGEALVLLAFACLSIVITVVQESRTERVLEALRDLASPRALVIRDGERRRIAGREVVVGDLMVVGEGDRVAADAVLIDCHDLEADESLLTGEAVPVGKVAAGTDRPPLARPGGDGLAFVFSGAMIVRGSGLAEVVATGGDSEMGRIGRTLAAWSASSRCSGSRSARR
jgi:Ca2+-transporting ATPase